MGSVALHELYFANLGGFRRAGPNAGLGRPDWHEVPDEFAQEIAAGFASAAAWRREFTAMAHSLAAGSGWVVLCWSRRQKCFSNQIATDHAQVTHSIPEPALHQHFQTFIGRPRPRRENAGAHSTPSFNRTY